MKVITSSGKMVDSDTYMAADQLVKLSKTKPMWDVIEKIVEVWIKTRPAQYKSYILDAKDVKDTRINDHASTRDKSLRYLVDIPEKVYLMMRIIYPVDVLPLDKKFLREFARRFPVFRIAKKI